MGNFKTVLIVFVSVQYLQFLRTNSSDLCFVFAFVM